MRAAGLLLTLLSAPLLLPGAARSGAAPGAEASRHSVGGYVRLRPGVETGRNFSDPRFSFLVHNRLNYRLDITGNTRLRLEGRNRLSYRGRPPGAVNGRDEGFFNLAGDWLTAGAWHGRGEIDRLHLDHAAENWRLRLGRQRVNWGVTLVSNPNDLFNLYSFFDSDYPERPGADALRVEYFRDRFSTLEFAAAAGRDSSRSVFAFKYLVNRPGHDLQLIAGRCRRRPVLGAGWATSIREAGFKGEASWFHGRRGAPEAGRGTLAAALGVDYMFAGGTYLVLEGLYNGGYGRVGGGAAPVTEPLRPDNIMFSRLALTASADHAFSPILGAGLAVMFMPDTRALYINPKLSRSLPAGIDLELAGQFYAGRRGTPLGEAGSALFATLSRSF